MSGWALSIVMIVPANLKDVANRLSCALGHDVLSGNTFSMPLSSDGSEPATHFGYWTDAGLFRRHRGIFASRINGTEVPSNPNRSARILY